MNVQFLGAAQTVTGSCFVIEACGARFSVDCGMHQGNSEIEKRNYENKEYSATELDFIILTHAHIDHSGLIPLMIKDGFKGKIYCTAPTADLVSMMLEDSGHIQETEAAWHNKKMSRRGEHKLKDPLYTVDDAKKVPNHLSVIEYENKFEPHPGIVVKYRDAGHILGAAFIEISITEDGKTTRLVFSGDLGRPGTLLMNEAEAAHDADYLFLESTYGDRNHKNEEDSLDELLEAITFAVKHNQKVIIPAFAVGRTQEILYCLLLLHRKNLLPNIPIYVDSPMAIKATQIFMKYREFLSTPEVGGEAGDLELPNLNFVLTAQESQALNATGGSGIIIAASGMCNAGRIRHHLRHNLWKAGTAVVFVGYQGQGTPGRAIVDGVKSLRMFGEDIAVKAKIFTIGGFSAHAGQEQLLDWLSKMHTPNLNVVLVHGEEKAQGTLAGLIKERFGIKCAIPDYLDTMDLTASAATQATSEQIATSVKAEFKLSPNPIVSESKAINFDALLERTDSNIDEIKKMLININERPWSKQVEIRDRLLDLNKELMSVISEL